MSMQYYCNKCDRIFQIKDLNSIRITFNSSFMREIHWCDECLLKLTGLETLPNNIKLSYANPPEQFYNLIEEMIEEALNARSES